MSKTKQKTLSQQGLPVKQGFQQRMPKTISINARHEATVIATLLKHWDSEGVMIKTQSDIVVYAAKLVYHHISRSRPDLIVSGFKEAFDLLAERGLMQKRNFDNPAIRQDLTLSGTSAGIESLITPREAEIVRKAAQCKMDEAFFGGSAESDEKASEEPKGVEFAKR